MKRNAQQATSGLNRQRELAGEILRKYDEMLKSLDPGSKDSLENNLNDHSDLYDISDQLCLIENFLNSKVDGRPQPIDLSVSHGHSAELVKSVTANVRDEMLETNKRLKEWARCGDPGYDQKASIGNLEFGLKELAQLREWIDQVIDWHKKNPGRRKNK